MKAVVRRSNVLGHTIQFQSTPPVKSVTNQAEMYAKIDAHFNSRPPRKVQRIRLRYTLKSARISIRTPHKGARSPKPMRRLQKSTFQSTPPVKSVMDWVGRMPRSAQFQSTPLREARGSSDARRGYFNPRPMKRVKNRAERRDRREFQSTLPMKRIIIYNTAMLFTERRARHAFGRYASRVK